jgi:hypothetical protein
LPLPPFLGNLLLGLGAMLVVGVLAIVRAAASESVLGAGEVLPKTGRRKGLIAVGIAAVVVVLALTGGWYWWMTDEHEFRRSLREGAWPDLATTVETSGKERILHLTLGEKEFKPNYALPLLPDHGKLLHLFLIREPARDAFAHVHPIRRGGKNFDLVLPALPEGDYKILCDFTLSESGLSSTASGTVHLPAIPKDSAPAADGGSLKPDPDDSWFVRPTNPVRTADNGDIVFAMPKGVEAVWKAHPQLRAKCDAHLKFEFRDSSGQPIPLEPYMGMLSHAAVLRADGGIFAHLHPTGNFSMAAQSYFDAKMARETGGPAPMDHSKMHHGIPAGDASVALPYEFPTSGDYQIWVQIKTGGQVLTATFDSTVAP